MHLFKVLKGKFSPVLLAFLASVAVSFATRIFILLAGTHTGISILQTSGLFLLGFLYDVGVAGVSVLLLLVYIWFQNNTIYQRKIVPWVVGLLLLMLGLLLFTNILPKDYNRQVHQALVIYLAVRVLIYVILAFSPYRFRIIWRRLMLYFFVTVILFLLLLNAVSEWFFWQEFSTRYNFIAVDNLIYTHEVIGNIVQSYHTYLIIGALVVIAIATTYLFYKPLYRSVIAPTSFTVRTGIAMAVIFVAATTLYIPEQWRHFSKNEYANELAGNG
ncbi:MAG: LTA synthase family protein, partial [Sphingobacteriaceae bacterium]